MSSTVKVPDIGGFEAVEIIEILVQPGDTVSKEQSLITLESDKASMDIPCPQAGVVKKLLVKLGDKVSEGTPIIELQAASAEAQDAKPTPQPTPKPASPDPKPASPDPQSASLSAQVLVLGAGPGGYTAAFRAADLGLKVVLVERYPSLGGVCLNVGCIPSKALLHAAKVITEAEEMAHHGVSFAKPVVDLDTLRNWKANDVVAKLTNGLMGLAKARQVTVIQGTAQFTSPNTVSVQGADGQAKTIHFENAIIAAGSSAIKLPFQPDDPRVIDSTGALALADVPARLLVIGGGIIGLEMGTVYDALGSRVTVVERGPQLITGCDPDL
ncbi:MAG: FAD-dependent oxidoreductase, partial [Betaproteobacteria bacterium]|nr:FAD-dependent oxidoreductase [Betaproteobacteria bacterium]